MGLFGGGAPSIPATTVYNPAPIVLPPTPVTPPAANSPIVANAQTGGAYRAAAAGQVGGMAGFDNTVATSPLGAGGGPTASKTLLGS